MSQSAYLYFVEGSAVPSITLEELKEQLERYRDQTSRTGNQLNWNYADAAFPYILESKPESGDVWFYLKGKNDLYKYIVFGVGRAKDEEGKERHYVQVVLPDGCTHGDKSKANEFCKYLARQLKAELHLFNGRIMYYNPRK